MALQLGMGDSGALASASYGGRAVLFKRFADRIEWSRNKFKKWWNSNLNKKFFHLGGINLEDIAAPDCFVVEEKKEIQLFVLTINMDYNHYYSSFNQCFDITKKK